jgi:hypothetical protein
LSEIIKCWRQAGLQYRRWRARNGVPQARQELGLLAADVATGMYAVEFMVLLYQSFVMT